MSDVLVVGAGAWGTALAIQALRAGQRVTLWARDPARITDINPRLPSVALPPDLSVTGRFPDVADAILLAMPLQHMRAVVSGMPTRGPLLACAKGVETGTLKLPLEILAELRPDARAAVLTGPNFANEIALGQPAAAVIAAADAALREDVSALLATPLFRLYGSADPVGAQIGGAAKNVIAIAAGAVIGAGLGENARAALMTRGLAEMSRLTVALGGQAETAMGLSGLGDLLLTCTGPASRNFSLGLALGRGATLAGILAARSAVTEGVATAPALLARAGGIELPVCAAVVRLLAGQTDLRQAIADLLARPRREE